MVAVALSMALSHHILYEMVYLRIRISIQPQKIDLNFDFRGSIRQLAIFAQRQSRTICILVRIEQNVRSIVFVVTASLVRNVESFNSKSYILSSTPIWLKFQDIGPRAFRYIKRHLHKYSSRIDESYAKNFFERH